MYGESTLRVGVMALPFLMPLEMVTHTSIVYARSYQATRRALLIPVHVHPDLDGYQQFHETLERSHDGERHRHEAVHHSGDIGPAASPPTSTP